MKVKFLGVATRKTQHFGCNGCGSGGSMSGVYKHTKKTVALLSGQLLDVTLGKEYEVSDEDGFYLLNLCYVFDNKRLPMFEVV